MSAVPFLFHQYVLKGEKHERTTSIFTYIESWA